MFKRRLFHIAFVLLVAFSVFGGSFVGHMAVETAVAKSDIPQNTPGNPLSELKQSGTAYTGSANRAPRDLRYTVANLIKRGLQLVGLVMICLMLYSGFLWFSARGNDDQVQQAKDVIRNAVIGMILVAMSYTLVSFVFRSSYVVQDDPTSRECSGVVDAINPFSSCE